MKQHSDHSVKEKPFSTSNIGVCSGAETDNSLSLHLFGPQISSSFSVPGMPIQARWNFDDGQPAPVNKQR
jgi:hypothetical protein